MTEPKRPSASAHEGKQQFNLYLPTELVKRVKHAAVDHEQSLSAFVQDALEEHLQRHPQR